MKKNLSIINISEIIISDIENNRNVRQFDINNLMDLLSFKDSLKINKSFYTNNLFLLKVYLMDLINIKSIQIKNYAIDNNKLINEYDYIIKNIHNENIIKTHLFKRLNYFFRKNYINISLSLIKSYFMDYVEFIINNIKDNVINNNNDLTFYIINELNLTINNTDYLKKIIFNNQYKKFNSNYRIIEI